MGDDQAKGAERPDIRLKPMLGRMRETRRSLDALDALAMGRSTRLADCVDREGGIYGLADALLAFYTAKRADIDLHEGDEQWAPYVRRALMEFDESVSMYRATLYCAIKCALVAPEWCSFGSGDSSKATFASLLNLFKPTVLGLSADEDVLYWDENGEEAGTEPAPAESHQSCYVDNIEFVAELRDVWQTDLDFEEAMTLVLDYFVKDDRSTTFINMYSPCRSVQFLELLPYEVEEMADAYLCDRGFAPAADDEAYEQVMAAIENAKRAVWAATSAAGRARA